jgi:hypothetical protein
VKEKIANLFLFVNDGMISEVGVVWHDRDGTDEEKLFFLQAAVDSDFQKSTRHRLPKSYVIVQGSSDDTHLGAFTYDSLMLLRQSDQEQWNIFLENVVWCHYDFVPATPLMCVTPIVNGKIAIECEQDYSAVAFSLGLLVANPGAKKIIPADEMVKALKRHGSKDWGDIDAKAKARNDEAIDDGDLILSEYHTATGVKFWVITEGDRSETTVTLPDEYQP